MNHAGLFRSALVALTRNKLRSLLTVLGITIGIAAVICVVAIGKAGQARVEQQLNNLGDNFVWIEAGGRAVNGVRTGTHDTKTLVMGDAIAIKSQVSLIKSISPNVDDPVQVVYGNQNWHTSYRGVSPEYFDIKRWYVDQGAFFSQDDVDRAADVCVLGRSVRDQLFEANDPIGKVIRINNLPCKVVATLVPKGLSLSGQDQDDTVIVPYTMAQKKIKGITWLDDILCSAVSQDAVNPGTSPSATSKSLDTKEIEATPTQACIETVIHVEELHKYYELGETRVHALRGVSLSVERGDFLAIMGASGSGKSTFMNILGCLDKPTSGRYLLEGIDVSKHDRKALAQIRNQKLGFVFQGFNLLARTTAQENTELPTLYTRISKAEREQRAAEALAMVGLADRAHHFPSQMSGGQQQRVAIARALVNHPSILLADEPTGNLDSRTSVEIMEILQNLNDKGLAVILVTHEHDIAQFAKRVLVFRDGKIRKDDLVGNRPRANEVLKTLPTLED
jgi:putative ABC transport system ATP-binding protein